MLASRVVDERHRRDAARKRLVGNRQRANVVAHGPRPRRAVRAAPREQQVAHRLVATEWHVLAVAVSAALARARERLVDELLCGLVLALREQLADPWQVRRRALPIRCVVDAAAPHRDLVEHDAVLRDAAKPRSSEATVADRMRLDKLRCRPIAPHRKARWRLRAAFERDRARHARLGSHFVPDEHRPQQIAVVGAVAVACVTDDEPQLRSPRDLATQPLRRVAALLRRRSRAFDAVRERDQLDRSIRAPFGSNAEPTREPALILRHREHQLCGRMRADAAIRLDARHRERHSIDAAIVLRRPPSAGRESRIAKPHRAIGRLRGEDGSEQEQREQRAQHRISMPHPLRYVTAGRTRACGCDPRTRPRRPGWQA